MKNLLFLFLFCMSGIQCAHNKDSVAIIEDQILIDPVEIMPEFQGGEVALYKFISENMVYPKEAMENATQGRVIIQFVIEKDGSITNIVVIRGVSNSLDAEAIRVVGQMPKWKPAEQLGKPVRVKYTLPIVFKFN